MDNDVTRIPLRNIKRQVIAYALVAATDADLVAGRRWYRTRGGYAASGKGTDVILMHRLVLGLERGNPLQADHMNRDRLDNRRSNLRAVTPKENSQNCGSRGGSSEHRGVTWVARRQQWAARVSVGPHCRSGYFNDEGSAAEAARAWRLELMPGALD